MAFPNDRKYTKDHEWAKFEGQTALVGITDHAQFALGDVVFVELPAVGKLLKKGESFGVVESIKAVSDLFSPVTGKITEVNTAVKDDPSCVNKDPHEKAWLIKLEMSSPEPQQDLMNAADYEKYVQSLK